MSSISTILLQNDIRQWLVSGLRRDWGGALLTATELKRNFIPLVDSRGGQKGEI